MGEQSSIAVLDPTSRSSKAEEFETALRAKIVGQESGIRALADLYQVFCAGLNSPGRPVGNLLFLGPTGSGKTRLVEAAAEILFGTPQAAVKVDCAEFQHSHEIAKLLGSPPGYLGHRETQPLITQDTLCRYHTDDFKLSLLLFDEIEKASDALWQLLLGMMDKATLTLGDNRRVDMSQTMIILTSNLGARQITGLMTDGIGFMLPKDGGCNAELDNKIERTAIEAARRRFSPEFMNRLDKTVVFHPLHADQLNQILDIELNRVQQRILEAGREKFLFRVAPAARAYLLQEGTSMEYGARHLKRAIERHIVYPLANLLATHQVELGDVLYIDWDERDMHLAFHKKKESPEGLIAAASTENPPCAAASSGASAERHAKSGVTRARMAER